MIVEFLKELFHALPVDEGKVLDELGLEFLAVGLEVLIEVDCQLVQDRETSVEEGEDLLGVVPDVALVLDLTHVVEDGDCAADVEGHLCFEEGFGEVGDGEGSLDGEDRGDVPEEGLVSGLELGADVGDRAEDGIDGLDDVFEAELGALFEVGEDVDELLDHWLGADYLGDGVVLRKIELEGVLEILEYLCEHPFDELH